MLKSIIGWGVSGVALALTALGLFVIIRVVVPVLLDSRSCASGVFIEVNAQDQMLLDARPLSDSASDALLEHQAEQQHSCITAEFHDDSTLGAYRTLKEKSAGAGVRVRVASTH